MPPRPAPVLPASVLPAASAAFGLAFLAAALFINPGLVNSPLPDGPGMTIDESFNILQGIQLAHALEQHGPLLFTPTIANTVFKTPEYLPDHPPLGRLLIGLAHETTAWLIPGAETAVCNVAAARLGSCFAFALNAALLCGYSLRRYGPAAAFAAAAIFIGSPQLIGHARLAALETTVNLAWTAAILPLLAWWSGTRPPSTCRTLLSGAAFGLLLLAKVQAILLPPVLLVWALLRFRRDSLLPLLLWSATAALVFFAAWPWLWQDTTARILQYLGRTTDRIPLYCWYLSERWLDREVPWHYPFVLLTCTLPAAVVIGLGLRARAGMPAADELLLLMISLFPVLVFALPGVPVYDGNRLFLICFPGLILLAAGGWRNLARHPVAKTALILLPLPWTMQPFAINQYGILCGGNAGAAAIGLEAGYWADALNGKFWTQIPENSSLLVAPVSHQFQLSALQTMIPVIQQRNIRLKPWLYEESKEPLPCRLLLIHRLADLRPELSHDPPDSPAAVTVTSGGTVLARIVDLQQTPE
ncbi:MAG TPA: hypothetical protein DC058_03865 [Planctomycetaceae bacterium]|nr:hypothetical protein [Planctomycetaceae bacterium]HBC60340.1 hypothetical protein [Planctomycetaceae bacterium]